MKVFNNLSEVKQDKNTFLTLGTFDGIHVAHKKIIDCLLEKASQNNGRSFLITFDPHPRNVLSDKKIKLLNTLQEKIDILENLGVENILVINFTKEFSQLNSDEFFKNYIVDKIGISGVVIGYDHRFGKGRGGDEKTLLELSNQYDFVVSKVDAVTINGDTVSSTRIRNTLSGGDIQLANLLLGRHYSFSGTIVKGDGRGKTLGFPTANIKLEDDNKLFPPLGIYVVEIEIEKKKHFGLMSIGKRPTFYNNGSVTTEVYIYDFDEEIYENYATVKILDRIRGEEKFSSAEELISQMKKDKELGLEILSRLINF